MTTFDIKVAIGLSEDADHTEFNRKVADLKNVANALRGANTSFDETDELLFVTTEVEGESTGEVVRFVIDAVRENALAVHVEDTEFTVTERGENGEFVVVAMRDVATEG
jgi:hypothetical protein